MPATLSKTRKPRARSSMTREEVLKRPPLPKPAKPYPGYMTDEWYEYLSDSMLRMTKAEVEATLVRAGVTDKEGNLTAPYRDE